MSCCFGSCAPRLPEIASTPTLRHETGSQDRRPPKRIILIHNPHAGAKRRSAVEKAVVTLRKRGVNEILTLETEYARHATVLARSASLDGVDAIVVAGGDGTLRETLSGLEQRGDDAIRRVPVVAIPVGTGNNVVRDLSILTPEDAIDAIVSGHIVHMDSMDVHSREGRVLSINVVSTGTPAVASEIAESLRCLGNARYSASAIGEIIMNPAYPVHMAASCRLGTLGVAPALAAVVAAGRWLDSVDSILADRPGAAESKPGDAKDGAGAAKPAAPAPQPAAPTPGRPGAADEGRPGSPTTAEPTAAGGEGPAPSDSVAPAATFASEAARPCDPQLAAEGELVAFPLSALFLQTTRCCGNGFAAVPFSQVNDGVMDLMMGPHSAWGTTLHAFNLMKTASAHGAWDRCYLAQLRELYVNAPKPMLVNIDGDVNVHTPLLVRVQPGGWLSLAPPQAPRG